MVAATTDLQSINLLVAVSQSLATKANVWLLLVMNCPQMSMLLSLGTVRWHTVLRDSKTSL